MDQLQFDFEALAKEKQIHLRNLEAKIDALSFEKQYQLLEFSNTRIARKKQLHQSAQRNLESKIEDFQPRARLSKKLYHQLVKNERLMPKLDLEPQCCEIKDIYEDFNEWYFEVDDYVEKLGYSVSK